MSRLDESGVSFHYHPSLPELALKYSILAINHSSHKFVTSACVKIKYT